MVKDFNGGILIDTRITFGGVAACGSFGRPANVWKQIMEAEFNLIGVFRWVNNNLFVKSPESTTITTGILGSCMTYRLHGHACHRKN
jgi:hypothetical protein